MVAGSSPVDRPFLLSMTWIEAFILGIVQGATEFFPISSSAHLKLAKLLFGIEDNGAHQIFNLFCHLGTLVALVSVFRKEIFDLFFTERKKLLHFILALLPLIPGYFVLHPFLCAVSTPAFLGAFLLVTSGILFLGNRCQNLSEEKKPFRDALYIGSAQVLALIPGISRSASTICCARFLGWTPKEAVRFSFLLSVPTIFGGSSLELFRLFYLKLPSNTSVLECSIGFFSSFIMGMALIRFSLYWLEKGVLKPFAWYCLVIGTLTLIFFCEPILIK
ncbi:MAG TPA: undecaprenyl-diphosphate phosphatase [Rhabdochlamydiaceae bacterium]|nr:undecaprenyl-diphosphate phosphatase [Rhabdochlamydiaceae bacterium]